jgi:hypothetical protein
MKEFATTASAPMPHKLFLSGAKGKRQARKYFLQG